MNKEIFTFLTKINPDTIYVNRLLVSSFLEIKGFNNINNQKISKLIIKPINKDEYNELIELILLIKKIEKFDFEQLLELFEFVISPSDKLVNGAIYTPDNIRQYITKQSFNTLKIKSLNKVKVVDIACGCGGFLIDACKELKAKTNKSYKKIFQDNIYGVDIQKYSVERTEILLILLAITENEDEKEFTFNIYQGNSLEYNWEDTKFDLIIGNPPYVCSRNMDERTKELMQNWSTCKTGHPDLYIPFFQIGYELLTDNGILGYITVNTFLHSVNGRAIREYFTEKKVSLKIIDFRDEQIFKSRMTYTCLCFLEKKEADYVSYTYSKEVNLKDIDLITFNEEPYHLLDVKKGWSLKNTSFINTIESLGTPFQKLYNTKSGIATLKNKVYIFKSINDDDEYFYMEDGTPIEQEICKEVINSNQFNTSSDIETLKEKIIFPYTHDDNNQAIIIDEDVFKKKFPKAYEYLLTKKELLSTRDKGNGKYPVWYSFGRTQSLEKVKHKLFFPQLVKKGFKAILNSDENLYFYNGMAAYANTKKDLKILQKLLVSSVAWKYIENKSKHYASGYFGLGKNYLKDFGVYNFNEDDIKFLLSTKNEEKLNAFITKKYNLDI